MTEQQIIEGLAQNDRKTTEHVYKTLAPPIFKYVLSNSGTRDEAQDLFQETFIKVLKNIHDGQYNHREKFEAYFLTVARYTWLDQLRVRKSKQWVGDDDLLLRLADENDEEALLELILHDKRLESLLAVWATWEDTLCRRVLQRFHFDNIRTKDIATEEETTQNVILQRLYKCRSKLFRLVQQQIG
jgi:RNA polymerase sigma factor (sigma-70 family)